MNNTSNKGSAVAALRILYLAMLSGSIMLTSVIYVVSSMDDSQDIDLIPNILLIVLVVATLAVTVSSMLWRKDVLRIREGNGLVKEKLEAYRAAAIKRYAITEFSVLFSVICYFISHEVRLFFVIGLLIIHFLTMYPSLSKIAKDLGEDGGSIEAL